MGVKKVIPTWLWYMVIGAILGGGSMLSVTILLLYPSSDPTPYWRAMHAGAICGSQFALVLWLFDILD